MNLLSRRAAVGVFFAFAFAYFFSALVRAITATLAPTLSAEFSLQARDLGLLAGGYFFGFAALQLPLGAWLDRYGPKNVILGFLSVAVLGCAAFAVADGFWSLLAARVLCGAGVSACLMAPLTGYRRWLSPANQMRATSWMLMSGSLGMLASTLPVQWLQPLLGWRLLFWGLAGLIGLAMLHLAWQVPAWSRLASVSPDAPTDLPADAPGDGGYAQVWRNPYFRRLAPLAFFNYGGLVAIQTLWAGPWLVKVAGYSALQAATGLFWINLTMLFTFWAWGLATPALLRMGWGANRLMRWGVPSSLFVLAMICIAGSAATTAWWALFCVCCSFIALSQPAVAMAFPPALAGRALSGYNLAIFSGVFVVQWGIGLLVDGFGAMGLSTATSFQAAMAVFLLCCVAAYAWFIWSKPDNETA
jgi:MFS family permease